MPYMNYVYCNSQNSKKNTQIAECIVENDTMTLIQKYNGNEKITVNRDSVVCRFWEEAVRYNFGLTNNDITDKTTDDDIKSTVQGVADNLGYTKAYVSNAKSIINGFFKQMNITFFVYGKTIDVSENILITERPLSEVEDLQKIADSYELKEQHISQIIPDREQNVCAIIIGKDDCIKQVRKEFLGSYNTKMLLTGTGGIGKTNLMRLIVLAATDFITTYRINLPNLLMYSCSHEINSSQLAQGNTVSHGGKTDQGYTTYITQFLKLKEFPQKDCLFLFDGLNELEDMSSNRTAALIDRLYKEIKDICSDISYRVIVSTRYKKTADRRLSNIAFQEYRPDPLTISESEFDDLFADGTSEQNKKMILELLSLPLYYNLYQKYFKKDTKDDDKKENDVRIILPDSPFNLMKCFYAAKAKDVINKNGQDGFALRSLYFLILPLLAHEMHKLRVLSLTTAQAERIITGLNNVPGNILAEMINYCTKNATDWIKSENEPDLAVKQAEEFGIPSVMSQGESIRTIDTVINEACNSDIICYEENEGIGRISFSHQEWRDFLGAYYVINYLNIQKKRYDADRAIDREFACEPLFPVFNLPTYVQKTISDVFHFYPAENDDAKDTDDVKERRAALNYEKGKVFKEFFALKTEMPHNNNTIDIIESSMTRLFTAFELYDHFMLHHYKNMYELAEPFYTNIIAPLCTNDQDLTHIFTNKDVCLRYCKSVAALMECARRAGEFSFVYELHDTVMISFKINKYKSSRLGEHMLTYRILQHQYAKAYLFESVKKISEGDTVQGSVQFRNAVRLLDENSTCNMSANLLGCMYATPCRFLTENTAIVRDPVKAAEIYDKAFSAMTSKAIAPLLGTELLYTGMQYVNLMSKGYVRYTELPDGNCKWRANTNDLLPDKATLLQMKKILDQLEGQDYSFLNWNRAMLLIYSEILQIDLGDGKDTKTRLETAADLLLSESNNIMTMTIRLANVIAPDYWPEGQSIYCQKNDKYTNKGTEEEKTKLNESRDRLNKIINGFDDDINKAKLPDETDKYYYLNDLERLCGIIEQLAKIKDIENVIQLGEIKNIRKTLGSLSNYAKFGEMLSNKAAGITSIKFPKK